MSGLFKQDFQLLEMSVGGVNLSFNSFTRRKYERRIASMAEVVFDEGEE